VAAQRVQELLAGKTMMMETLRVIKFSKIKRIKMRKDNALIIGI
jgi:hypothetical protein